MKKTIAAIFAVLLGGSLVLSFAGCAGEEKKEDDLDVNLNADLTAEGVDKTDPYTWFDVQKEVLPTRAQCQEITVGMMLNEVIEKIGKPQRDIGYGACLFQFDVADGSVFTVKFLPDFLPDSAAGLLQYDRLIVSDTTFDAAVPDLYFPQQVTLEKLYPWMEGLEEGDIVKVRYEQAFIGVAPYVNLKNIAYSTDQKDLANAYRLFSSSLHAISQSEGQIDGGGYVRYDFMTAEETYSVTFSNNTVLIGERYYRFDGKLFEFAAPELGEFEFRVYDGLLENAPRYVLKSAGGVDLLILSADKFLIEGDKNTVIYQITGEKDFSFLF